MTNEEKKQEQEQYELPPIFDYAGAVNAWESGEKPFVEALMSAYKKPEQRLTPEQAKKARTAAAISDSLTSLAEMFGYTQGVKTRDRTGKKTSVQTTNEKIDFFKDKYEQDMLRYNSLKGNAMREDFATQLRASMAGHQQQAQAQQQAADRAYQEEAYQRQRKDRQEDSKQAIKDKQEYAEWEFENVYKPKLQAQQRYNPRVTGRSSTTTTSSSKNIFEFSVPEGTEGADFDPHTGKWYVREELTPARQQSILSNLPGGKAKYIEENGLFREQQQEDAYGQTKITKQPWSDADVIRFYLENHSNIRSQNQPYQGQVRGQNTNQPQGNVR